MALFMVFSALEVLPLANCPVDLRQRLADYTRLAWVEADVAGPHGGDAMTHLTAAQVEHLAEVLRERERVLREEIRAQLLLSEQQHHVDLAGLVHDEADDAVASMLADLDLAAIHRDVQELREVQSATTRLQTRNYGVCMKCGIDIAYERLAAQPAARRCIECENKHERMYAHDESPKL
jgi:RNA polymerase-binding protein DksA